MIPRLVCGGASSGRIELLDTGGGSQIVEGVEGEREWTG